MCRMCARLLGRDSKCSIFSHFFFFTDVIFLNLCGYCHLDMANVMENDISTSLIGLNFIEGEKSTKFFFWNGPQVEKFSFLCILGNFIFPLLHFMDILFPIRTAQDRSNSTCFLNWPDFSYSITSWNTIQR